MTLTREYGESRQAEPRVPREERGFSMVELVFVVMFSLILVAMAVPQIGSTMSFYRLQGAVANATWAAQSTRYQALMAGYPYQVVFTKSNYNYQIQNLPTGAASYANVGAAVPLSGSTISLNQDTTLRFSPNGSVSAPTGALTFTLTFNGSTKTITVSTYGNVKVTP